MTNRERLNLVLNNKMPADRLPIIEWATWWDQTISRWRQDGLSDNLHGEALFDHLGLDVHRQFWINGKTADCPAEPSNGAGILSTEQEYDKLYDKLYSTDKVKNLLPELQSIKHLHQSGDIAVWLTFEGFFWHPRTLFGIENHLYSFYDNPDLYHKMCEDLVTWQIKSLEIFCSVLTPDFMTLAEDMSYNHGPMISKDVFDEFCAPYYRRLVSELKKRGIKVIVDTDGDVTSMIPWLKSVGVDGVLPLERKAGVDVADIKKQHPDFLLVGAFDKTIMHEGETAMRAEFERLLPTMKRGGFIPSVDHQTPPDVSLENYRLYVKLMNEYCAKACKA